MTELLELTSTAMDDLETASSDLARLQDRKADFWKSSQEDLISAGSLLENLSGAVGQVSFRLTHLMEEELVVDQSLTVTGLPKTPEQRREFLAERPRGRRLTKMKGEAMQPGSCGGGETMVMPHSALFWGACHNKHNAQRQMLATMAERTTSKTIITSNANVL